MTGAKHRVRNLVGLMVLIHKLDDKQRAQLFKDMSDAADKLNTMPPFLRWLWKLGGGSFDWVDDDKGEIDVAVRLREGGEPIWMKRL